MNPDFKLFGTRNGPEAARNYLESLLAKQTSQFHAIRVVYDSPSLLKTSEKRLGLRIIYARLRGEDQQADDEIVHFLETFGPEGAENPPVWLVSDDRGLRLRAASHCQGFVACEDLIRHLMLS